MSVLISGSIAYDTILAYEGRFADKLRPEAISHLNLTFPAATMRRAFGGCAANIAYALKRLGGKPLLWSAMGKDAAPYMARFRELGISTAGLLVLEDAWMPQAFITTDAAGNQLTTFHGGAMDRTQEVPFPDPAADPDVPLDAVTLAMLSPGGRIAMKRHAEIYVERGIPYIFDVGQAAPLFTGDELAHFIAQAAMVAFSDYEAELIAAASGIRPADMARMGKTVFHTHGARGSSVWLPGAANPVPIEAAPIPGGAARDPVGAGDAYRGGLLYGLTAGLDPVQSARIASVMGALKVSTLGVQNYTTTLDDVRMRFEALWGKAPF